MVRRYMDRQRNEQAERQADRCMDRRRDIQTMDNNNSALKEYKEDRG
jgi:hypothetical protein